MAHLSIVPNTSIVDHGSLSRAPILHAQSVSIKDPQNSERNIATHNSTLSQYQETSFREYHGANSFEEDVGNYYHVPPQSTTRHQARYSYRGYGHFENEGGRYQRQQRPQVPYLRGIHIGCQDNLLLRQMTSKKVKVDAKSYEGKLDRNAFLDWLGEKEIVFVWQDMVGELRISLQK
jgi:hypothetical protein